MEKKNFILRTVIAAFIVCCGTFVAQAATVTYKIVNGTWSDGTTVKTETVATGNTPQNIPTPKPDQGYGLGKWDENPAGQTINGDKTFTYSYFHYTISYDTGGKVTVEPEQSYWYDPGDGTGGIEVFGYPGYCKEIQSGDDWYAIDLCGLNNPNPWFLDPDDINTVVDWGTEVTGDVTVYCKWKRATKIVDAVSITVDAKAGETIPDGQYNPNEYSLDDFGLSAPAGADYEIGWAAWEYPEGATKFEEGETYNVRIGISTGDRNTSTVFFKGHGTVKTDPDTWEIINLADCFTLAINGVEQGVIENIGSTMAMINFNYTVPKTTSISVVDSGELTADSWYSIDGRRLEGEPTAKGVYIKNGKKVIKQ